MQMQMDELIAKINELANKAKKEGLTDEEKVLQNNLRQEYLNIFRSNFRKQLDNTKIKTPDGKVHSLKHAPKK